MHYVFLGMGVISQPVRSLQRFVRSKEGVMGWGTWKRVQVDSSTNNVAKGLEASRPR